MSKRNKKISIVTIAFLAIAFIGYATSTAFKTTDQTEKKGVIQMNKSMYIEKIHDFAKSPNTFKFKGNRPAVVDFYADWCRPCKRIAPIMEELSVTYKDKIDFYKVNVDKEGELAMIHSVQSIPVVMFFSKKGQPKSVLGALNKEDYVALIEETLKK